MADLTLAVAQSHNEAPHQTGYSAKERLHLSAQFKGVLKYDPDQARGPKGSPEGGQWVKGVSPERRKNPAGRIITHGPDSAPAVEGRTFTSEEGYQWHEKGPVAEWAKALPYKDTRAIDNYSGFGYGDVNKLRRGMFVPSTVAHFVRASSQEEYDASRFVMTPEYVKEHGHPFGKQPYERKPEDPFERVLDASGNYVGHIQHNVFYTNPAGEKVEYSVQRAGPDLERLATVQKEADALDDLIAHRGYVLPEAITVERGASFPGVTYEQLAGMQYEGPNGEPPAIWEEQGFVSTMVGDAEGRAKSYPALGKTESLYNRYGSNMYAHQDEVGEAIRFHITLPAGTKVASVESVRRLTHQFPRIPNPDPMTEEQAKDPFWIKNPHLWTKTDYAGVPTVDASNLEKGKEGRRVESELLLGSGARFRVVRVQPGESYHFYDPQVHDIPIREVYLEYIGGGSSDGRNN